MVSLFYCFPFVLNYRKQGTPTLQDDETNGVESIGSIESIALQYIIFFTVTFNSKPVLL